MTNHLFIFWSVHGFHSSSTQIQWCLKSKLKKEHDTGGEVGVVEDERSIMEGGIKGVVYVL